jgi:hypothetical protein
MGCFCGKSAGFSCAVAVMWYFAIVLGGTAAFLWLSSQGGRTFFAANGWVPAVAWEVGAAIKALWQCGAEFDGTPPPLWQACLG